MLHSAPSQVVYLREWWAALCRTPQIFSRTAFRRRTLEEELQEALLRGSLRKAFGGFELLCLGLGIVIGSGWAQLMGNAAQQYAGPAIIISYLVSGLAALLSATCYAELCAEYPVSGGAFSYVLVTFGELPAFFTLAGLMLEYALGMAAVARGFSDYLATLLNQNPASPPFEFELVPGGHTFDIVAAAIIMLMSVLLSLGVHESAFFISGITVVKILLLLFVCVASYTQGSWDNMNPFMNTIYDTDGTLMAASIVFFSYTGFDAIGNAAEEVRNVAHLPWAILGTVATSIIVYFMLAFGLALMVCPTIACPALYFLPLSGTGDCKGYSQMMCPQPCTCSTSAPPPLAPPPPAPSGYALAPVEDCYLAVTFVSAFLAHGMKWMQYIVSLAALSGIVTALTVGLFSLSRIVMAASRDWLLPPFLARISPRTQTPLVAQMVLGVIIAVLAMFVEVDAATSLVSFGTLVSMWLVCNAQMYRRYIPEVQMRFTRYGTVETAPKIDLGSWMPGRHLPAKARKYLVWLHLVLINAVSLTTAIYYGETIHQQSSSFTPAVDPLQDACNPAAANLHHSPYTAIFVLAWFLVTLSFQLCCPMEYEPVGWHIKWWLMPWLPSTAIGLIIFSVGALPKAEYWKIGFYFGLLVVVYLLFSLPMSYIRHSRVDYTNAEELKVVELTFVNAQWQPSRLVPVFPTPALHPAASSQNGDGPKDDLYHLHSGARSGSVRAGIKGSGPSASGRPGSSARPGQVRALHSPLGPRRSSRPRLAAAPTLPPMDETEEA